MRKNGPRFSSIRIIGLGNDLRGDDAVGLLTVRRLRQAIGDRAEVIEAGMVGVDLIELMKGASVVILIDAARSGKAPGSVHRLDASASPISGQVFPRSSHAIGVSEAIELARAMDVLPATVIVYGVEVGDMEVGQPLSPPLGEALDQVVKQIIQECEACHA
ncbi:MAG: hydrogenase maturation protease [Nitrospira sp.]|nr:hydrogenase maturation protease [Nitrospira sp.]MDH4369467.1 hydrogenase maturation protease [Nitrospira sp.]MDH5346747.1 hydrogenase maturation protease [Nitrospira sp.]MDH5496391.1 hydrogenase maturation protease [Nitrospira sp.]MDH5724275.1 hydrogenase maturation protease [Nitrospira sp.]